MKCTKCGCEKVRVGANLKGKIARLFGSSTFELKVYIQCQECGLSDLILQETKSI